jgi:energy-converting hydrogenase Eha subunit C
MKQRKIILNLDVIGFIASSACAIHCAIIPILLSVTSYAGLAFWDNVFIDIGMFFLSFILASYSLLRGHFKQHKKCKAIAFMIFGFSLIAASFYLDMAFDKIILSSVGALIVAVSHLINYNMCKKCKSAQ